MYTNREVFDGVGGGLTALNLGHLADLLFQSHSRKKVLDTSLYGFIGIFVNAIHVFHHLAHSDEA